MRKKLLSVVLCLFVLLSACHKDEEVEPSVEPSPEETSSAAPRPSYIPEWGGWEYDDPDIEVPTLKRNSNGDMVFERSDGTIVENKTTDAALAEIISAVEEVGINNSWAWWKNDSTHYAYYGIDDAAELDAVLQDIGLSIEECPPNTITEGDGFKVVVSGSYAANYQVVIVLEEALQ